MNILLSPDKFKGSLSAQQVCDATRKGLLLIDPSLNITALPLADGGEGTCELLTTYSGGSFKNIRVRDPLFREINSTLGISKDGRTAFLEMAKASGLQLLKKEEQNPFLTSTVGTGDLILHALDHGVEKLIMGIGGSATTDGGMGMAQALGVIFYSASGEKLQPTGQNLKRIQTIDLSGLHPRLRDVEFIIFCDVDNPLHGLKGAAYIFSQQKGADQAMVKELDEGLQHYERKITERISKQVNFPGAGAGGGLPATIVALSDHVVVRPGMDFIIEFTRLEEQVRNADIVITGEGKIDAQTLSGKVVKGVSDLAVKHKKTVVAVTGKSELNEQDIRSLGITKLITLTDSETSEAQAIENAFEILSRKIQHELVDLLSGK